ncbi:GNAT family N-acetyltransferase [Paenibacillus lautus]|uniref:GNAT family N-acetyltransferase n=1 Tax=Paenibacillus lautus TaxID=1401 RepID=UPI003D2E4353
MLYGQRVILRPVVEEDWEQRYQWLTDPEVSSTLPSGTGVPLTPATVKKRTQKYAEGDQSGAYFTVLNLDGKLLGNAQLFKIDPWARKAEFGIWIGDKSVWGQGYGTEVTQVLVQFAFERLNLHKVYLTVDATNAGAIRCYEKAGFQRDGILRDEAYKNGSYVDRILMSLLHSEYVVGS